jgi:hypothetical protein
MVVFPIGNLTDFVNELTISIVGNSSLQHAERAIISASIVDRAVSVCNLDCQKTGQSAKVMMNPVRLMVQAQTYQQNLRPDRHQSCAHRSRGS